MNITGFEIIEKIGTVGAITVFKAKQLSLNRTVTLKVVEPKLSNIGEIKDFVHEARTVANFKHHNVIEVYDIGEKDDMFYVAYEYVNGETLRQIVDRDGAMPAKRALKICLAVADALQHAWSKAKIIHRDISPDNILINDSGQVKVAGLGQVKPTDPVIRDAYIQSGVMVGDLHFMAPEQARGETDPDVRTDIYSLGALLYYMLTTKAPFVAFAPIDALKKHLNERLPNPRDLYSTIPLPACQLVIKMMMKQRVDRFENWEVTSQEIQKAIDGKVLSLKPGSERDSTVMPVPQPTGPQLRKYVPPPDFPVVVKRLIWLVMLLWWASIVVCLLKPQIKQMINKPAAPTVQQSESSTTPTSEQATSETTTTTAEPSSTDEAEKKVPEKSDSSENEKPSESTP